MAPGGRVVEESSTPPARPRDLARHTGQALVPRVIFA
jgi:hypothetical protein